MTQPLAGPSGSQSSNAITLNGVAINGGTASNLSLSQGGTSGNTGMPLILAQSAVPASVTATATETTLATIALAAGLVAPNGRVRLRSYFVITSNTDTKTLRVRIGSAIVTLAVINGPGAYVILDADLMNVGGGQIAYVQSWIGANSYPGVVASTGGVASVDLTQAQSLTITGQLGTTTDTIQLLAYSAEVLNP